MYKNYETIETTQINNQNQYGENGHQEYPWSSNLRENILQFYFQLTRTSNDITLQKLESRLIYLLTTLTEQINTSEKETILAYLSYLYCLIGQTRDIIEGKGEYTLTYMMIYIWYYYYPELAFFALETLVQNQNNKNEHPYGSWKDMKYFYKYCRDKGCNDDHPLIQKIIETTNHQLRQDEQTFFTNSNISFVSKWIPREKSKKWENLYTLLACNYFKNYIETGKKSSSEKAVLKCKIEYRKMISRLNKYLDTTQVKQCEREWKEIDFNKVTSITLSKNKKAFLNVKKNGETRREEDDRILCAANFTKYIQTSMKNNTEIKGKRIGMNDFTKEALQLINERNRTVTETVTETLQTQIDVLNMQWKNNSTQTTNLKKMIGMIDVSGSMEGEPLYAAIALGIRIAEKSILGNRIMTFSANPTWVNLESRETFLDKVETIKESEWGLNTNFYKALDKILDAIIETRLPPEEVKDMTLVILSDMQIDQADDSKMRTTNEKENWSLYSNIREKYEETGIRLYGKPFQPPHILFWNLRSTDGFPNVSNEANTSMVSGFSPSLLNSFCENGVFSLHSLSPWSLFIKTMDNPRYRLLKTRLSTFF